MRCWMRPPLVTGASQRTRPSTAACEPSHAGFTPAGGAVDDPFLAPLAATYRDGALTVVVEEQGNDLAAAQPAAVEQGQHGGVAGAHRRVAAGLEQTAHLADVDVTAGRQRTRGDALDVHDAFFGFGVDQPEAPCFLYHSPDRGQDVVDSRRLGIFLDQDGAQGHDVLVADLGPVDRQGVGGSAAGEQLGGAIEGALQAPTADRRWLAGQVDRGGVVVERPRSGDDGNDGRRRN